jgi:hypothetical protein
VFSTAIAANLVQGRAPKCHCFGANSQGTVSWRTIARNAIFAVPAFVILWGGSKQRESLARLQESLGDFAHPQSFLLLLIGAFTVVEMLVSVQLLQKYGSLLHIVESAGLRATEASQLFPVGSTLPDFAIQPIGVEPSVPETSLWRVLRQGQVVLLVFADLFCKPCEALLRDIHELQTTKDLPLQLVVVSSDTVNHTNEELARIGVEGFLAIHGEAVRENFEIKVSPTSVLVGHLGSVLSEFAPGAIASRHLIRSQLERNHVAEPNGPARASNHSALFREI